MPHSLTQDQMKRSDEIARIQNQHHVDIQRLWRAFNEKPPTQPPTGGPTGAGAGVNKLYKLVAPLFRDTNSADAVIQTWNGSSWSDGTLTATIYADFITGYFFTGEKIWCFTDPESERLYPVAAGGTHFEGTGATIAQAATGSITLTQSRGTVTATARYGDVVSGDLVSVHWDHHEKKFFIGDSECS